MIKFLSKFIAYLTILILIVIGYLSYFGLETKSLNELIREEVTKKNKKFDVDLKTIKILLNLNNFSLNLKTSNPKIIFDKKKILIEELGTNISIKTFINKEFALDDLKIKIEKVRIKDLIELARIYRFNPELFVLGKIVKEGSITSEIFINFDGNGNIKDNYKINGRVESGKLILLNKGNIENLNFVFSIKKNEYLFNNLKAKINQIKIISNKIEVKNDGKSVLVRGNLKNLESIINQEQLKMIFGKTNKYLDFEKIDFTSDTQFSLRLNKRLKVKNLNFKSKIRVNELDYKFESEFLKSFIPSFNNSVVFDTHEINLSYEKNKFEITGKGNYSIDEKKDYIGYKILNSNNEYKITSDINFNKNIFLIDSLNFKKDENNKSLLNLELVLTKNKNLIFKKIFFKQDKNQFYLEDLVLDKNLKIKSVNKITLDFINLNNEINMINLKKNKKNYKVTGTSFDASNIIDQILNSKKKKKTSSYFVNLNSKFEINIKKILLDKISYANNFKGNLFFINNNLNKLSLGGVFPDNKKIILTINTNKNNEKITTLMSEYPKPLVKKYKFIKGFEEGVLDFYSIKKNNISNSTLKIDNFKVQEVPVLAKLLTLASLQGIADILTGEGIRFSDFEMKFSNSNNLMTISELYAIGPAISIMIDGYIENEGLISLRGTLVPATTINRTISSIPLIGNILVGKKVGEGIFGVSFKIKGPPKNLKTSVNPIKTLTPRFITRTLEKIKKN